MPRSTSQASTSSGYDEPDRAISGWATSSAASKSRNCEAFIGKPAQASLTRSNASRGSRVQHERWNLRISRDLLIQYPSDLSQLSLHGEDLHLVPGCLLVGMGWEVPLTYPEGPTAIKLCRVSGTDCP
jgi:hypothetical protein